MPKTIWTPRDELVCGKLDKAHNLAVMLDCVELVELLADIRHDCERMEQKLIARKSEVEQFHNKDISYNKALNNHLYGKDE